MSLRTSRRSQAAAASAAADDAPSVPISEIRVRKWTKQIKTVGHITIMKWVPEQEHPTEALQRGGFKKTKGRKRPVAEVGRMTRSVRQHLDAPLELLVEIPTVRQNTRATAGLGITPAAPEAVPATAIAATAASTTDTPAPVTGEATTSDPAVPPSAMSNVTSSESLLGMSSEAMMFSEGVASEEQLEQALDDLPFLDSDNLAMDPALVLENQAATSQRPSTTAPPATTTTTQPVSAPPTLVAQPSPDPSASASAASAEDDGNSSSSGSSDDDDDDDDGNETASVDSATPQQSPSPLMSRSPSP